MLRFSFVSSGINFRVAYTDIIAACSFSIYAPHHNKSVIRITLSNKLQRKNFSAPEIEDLRLESG